MHNRREFIQRSAMVGMGLFAAQMGLSWDKKLDPTKLATLEKAWELHKRCLIIDAHTDIALERIVGPHHEIPLKWMARDDVYPADIPRMRENGQQYVAFMIMSAGTGSTKNCFRNMTAVDQSIAENPTAMMQVKSTADAIAAGASGKVGIIYSIEGSFGPLDGDLDNLRKLYDRGLRHAGISHKEGGADPKFLMGMRSTTNMITEAVRAERFKTMPGLTPFGIEALKAMNELGIVVDLAHINDRAFFDVVEKSTTPPIVSHTVTYALTKTDRGMTDDQIKALAAKGGVACMTFVPEYVAQKKDEQTIDRYVDHICHAADLVGIDSVGIGSDYGMSRKILTTEVSQLVLVTQALMSRGFTEDEIRKLWGGNLLRVMKKTIDKP